MTTFIRTYSFGLWREEPSLLEKARSGNQSLISVTAQRARADRRNSPCDPADASGAFFKRTEQTESN